MAAETGLPLSGVRVLDFTQITLGPIATQMLGDFGADVIKIERPGGSDYMRTTLPDPAGVSFIFLASNRNKRALSLDLRKPDSREITLRLVRWADVLVHNFRPGTMERLGLGYEALRDVSPRLIYAVGSGYGLTGPYRSKGGQDVLAQALGGSLLRRSEAGAPPEPFSTPVCDCAAGMLLVQGILLALLSRHRTGVGQRVTTSLLDSMIYMQQQEATALLNADQVVNWIALPRNGTFQTKDGKWIVMIGAFKEDPLGDICRALDLEPLGRDRRFATEDAQQAHRAELQAIFKRRFGELTQEEALARLEREDVLCAPVHSLKEALDDPQVQHNEMVIDVPHPRLGSFRTVGIPVKLSETPGALRRHPPDPGENTREILAEVGYSKEEIDGFVRDGVV